ncbi:hypothetical protein GCM10010112_25680 [Actinoplanes lobatus]|nr:hypothetical protein GCM10010112_25680 [Actinoplanes lobatus]
MLALSEAICETMSACCRLPSTAEPDRPASATANSPTSHREAPPRADLIITSRQLQRSHPFGTGRVDVTTHRVAWREQIAR